MAGMKGFDVGFGALAVGGAGVLLLAMVRGSAERHGGPIGVAASGAALGTIRLDAAP